MQLRLTRDSSTILSTSTHLVGPQTYSKPTAISPVPVDLLKCSFVHCPSPDSSMDTLTSRQGHSQYSFGQGTQADNDSFHNLTAASNEGICSHSKHSEHFTDPKSVTFSNSDNMNNFTSSQPTSNHHHHLPYSNGALPGASKTVEYGTGLVNCIQSNSGHHVVLSTGHDSDNKPYALTMSRISNNIYTKYNTSRDGSSKR